MFLPNRSFIRTPKILLKHARLYHHCLHLLVLLSLEEKVVVEKYQPKWQSEHSIIGRNLFGFPSFNVLLRACIDNRYQLFLICNFVDHQSNENRDEKWISDMDLGSSSTFLGQFFCNDCVFETLWRQLLVECYVLLPMGVIFVDYRAWDELDFKGQSTWGIERYIAIHTYR